MDQILNKSFKKNYANYYDLLYKDKNYKAECDFLEKIFKKYGSSKPKHILDVACGTGRHITDLARRGYRITGFDASEEMIAIGKQRLAGERGNVKLQVATMQRFSFQDKFDAAISMFTAVSYLKTLQDLELFLRNLSRQLKEEALFVFDIWNGTIVPTKYSPIVIKEVNQGKRWAIRISDVKIDSFRQLCFITYRILGFTGNKLEDDFVEEHITRYYLPREMSCYLERSGFKVLGIMPFLNMDGEINDNIWDLCYVTKKS